MFKEIYETPELEVIEIYANVLTASCPDKVIEVPDPCPGGDYQGEPIEPNEPGI